jgi:hypothetical protein
MMSSLLVVVLHACQIKSPLILLILDADVCVCYTETERERERVERESVQKWIFLCSECCSSALFFLGFNTKTLNNHFAFIFVHQSAFV